MLGTLLNPYFPDHLEIAWLHFLFAFQDGDPRAPLGSELQVVPTWQLATRSPLLTAVFLIAIGYSVWDLSQGDKWANDQRQIGLFLLVSTLIFACATLINPRGLEYLFPLTAVLFAQILASRKVLTRTILLTLFALAAIFQSAPIFALYFDSDALYVNPGRLSAIRAVTALPEDSSARVLNCTFNTGPYLLHFRPQMRFVDLLDPRLYRAHSPQMYDLRNQLVHGKLDDPYRIIANVFDAEYVVCMRPGLTQQMLADPRFERISPPSGSDVVQTFRLLRDDEVTSGLQDGQG